MSNYETSENNSQRENTKHTKQNMDNLRKKYIKTRCEKIITRTIIRKIQKNETNMRQKNDADNMQKTREIMRKACGKHAEKRVKGLSTTSVGLE